MGQLLWLQAARRSAEAEDEAEAPGAVDTGMWGIHAGESGAGVKNRGYDSLHGVEAANAGTLGIPSMRLARFACSFEAPILPRR